MNAIIIAVFLFIFSHAAFADIPEEQVLEIITKSGSILSDPLIALTTSGKTFLPLQDMAKVLGVRTEQPEENMLLVYTSESDYQTIDLSNCFRPQIAPSCAYFIKSNGVIYASTDYLVKELSWPLSLDTKEMRILINISSSTKEAVFGKEKAERPLTLKRDIFGYPAFRVEGAFTTPEASRTTSLYAGHSLLDHDSKILYYTKDDYSRTRWTLSKEHFVEESSPLSPKSYELVSTLTTEMKYLFSPTPIIGAHVSNRRVNENVFDTHNIYEKGPPRWKVELTANGIYLGETYVDTEGNFSFLNVPLFYGENTLTYRFTSPLGKTTEYTQNYSVSDAFEKAHRLRYQISFGQIEQDSQYMGSAQVSYGLTSDLSIQAAAAQFPLREVLKQYSLVGVHFLQPFYSLSALRTSSTDNTERAITLTPKVNMGGVLVTSEYTEFDNFRTLLVNKTDTNKQISLGKISALSQANLGFPVTVQIQAEEDRYENSLRTQEAAFRAYAMFRRTSLLTEVAKAWPSDSNPDLYMELGDYHNSFRGKYGVLIQNDRYAKAKVGLETTLPYEVYLTAALESPPNINDGSYSLTVGRLFKELQVEVTCNGSSTKTYYGIILSTNIKTGPTGLRLSSNESYLQGQMQIIVFIDENGNGLLDEQEKPLPRVRVLHVQRQKEYETNNEGRILISNLSPYQRVSLGVIKESISNIFLTAKDFETDFMLTPGQQLEVLIPVVPSFDVRGMIQNLYYKKLVPLELLSSDGQVVAETVSAANGKYRFDDVALGVYSIRVSPKFLTENKLSASPYAVPIDVSGKAGVKVVAPFILAKRK